MKPITNTAKFKIKIIEAGISQTELAEEFKVSKQTVNGWVAGRIAPTLNTALRIAKRLNCSVNDLWEYNPES
ncbi:putative transcriptional regulator [Bacillus oleivorans]|uniref:Putative transcriptional regulator n=1 Tax=Bacillus oleivorans TaxID=1448271 RepID=A0A285D651_9BACI|nr:helix-turn-helix transcriptional regulator [Bacillus oleivorans]SNX75301.1 putative transcriptional regulator [Bacillus oleivorans]